MTKSNVGFVTNNNTSTTQQIQTPEIPIWVSDKKKWVTGFSKKTTINDIIYAILKQCNISCDYDMIQNEYVLVELFTNDQQKNEQRVLKGQSKVCKYLNKWIEQSNQQKIQLKVKKCELYEDTSVNRTTPYHNNDLGTFESNSSTTSSTSTGTGISKLFKKLTVNSNNNINNNSNNNNNNQTNNNNRVTITNSNSLTNIRYVDVKLPMATNTEQIITTSPQAIKQQKQDQNKSSLPKETFTHNQYSKSNLNENQQSPTKNTQDIGSQEKPLPQLLPYKQYDPTLQKSLIITNILDKDRKLNQQFERVKLLDEMIKETEYRLNSNEKKLATLFTDDTNMLTNSNSESTLKKQENSTNELTLNDIYACFPEMHTHSQTEVKEFYDFCLKILNLDESLHKKNQLLQKIESDMKQNIGIFYEIV